MSDLSTDPEVIPIGFGSIEVRPMERRTISRDADGKTVQGDPYYVEAHLRVQLAGFDDFFAFGITPQQARKLLESVERHCPDAEGYPSFPLVSAPQ